MISDAVSNSPKSVDAASALKTMHSLWRDHFVESNSPVSQNYHMNKEFKTISAFNDKYNSEEKKIEQVLNQQMPKI